MWPYSTEGWRLLKAWDISYASLEFMTESTTAMDEDAKFEDIWKYLIFGSYGLTHLGLCIFQQGTNYAKLLKLHFPKLKHSISILFCLRFPQWSRRLNVKCRNGSLNGSKASLTLDFFIRILRAKSLKYVMPIEAVCGFGTDKRMTVLDF